VDTTPTVFVVDPDSGVRDAVRDLAHLMNLRCETFASGEAFLATKESFGPGCVVLEVRIPGISGLEVQEQLNGSLPHLTRIFLTGHATVSMAVRAMRAGASHFLEKPFREHELWDAIQEAIAISRGRCQEQFRTHELRERLAQLTPKERQVLQLIAEGRSKRSIASELSICLRTVEIRRSQLMRKLGVASLAELIRFGVHAGGGEGQLRPGWGDEERKSGRCWGNKPI
jgi:FixJ family two-component response regulator